MICASDMGGGTKMKQFLIAITVYEANMIRVFEPGTYIQGKEVALTEDSLFVRIDNQQYEIKIKELIKEIMKDGP